MGQKMPYVATTHSITVGVRPIFLEDQSLPDEERFVWAYHIRIENHGVERVQLRRRHWQITDARGHIEVVDGDGVVGEQPVITPGGHFEYTSGAPLKTPSGFMVGHYEMEGMGGQSFNVEIPAFSLDSPYDRASVN